MKNKLNDLSGKEWLKFQKSWFVHNPPPRSSKVKVHPAKFPESLVEKFIRFFTKEGELVFDPMAGTGSTCLAALNCKRIGLGIELNPKYAKIANQRIETKRQELFINDNETRVIQADANDIAALELPEFDYVITSPPYWDMLREKGAQTQQERREDDELDVYYSDSDRDLGNIDDYNEFLDELCAIYEKVHPLLKQRKYITIIVKNVKKGGKIYPLAWDLARRLDGIYALKDEKIWCQDNQRLSPYGIYNAWVSNTFHHYCLILRKE